MSTTSSWTMAGIDTTAAFDGGVLVGDDGSGTADRALRYAVDEAARRGVTLHVVRAWTIPTAVRPADAPFGTTPSVVELQQATLVETRRRLDEAIGGRDDVVGEAHVVHGRADRALIAAAAQADVLVVGTRGRSKIGTLIVGSVAAACIREAPTPVVVVR